MHFASPERCATCRGHAEHRSTSPPAQVDFEGGGRLHDGGASHLAFARSEKEDSSRVTNMGWGGRGNYSFYSDMLDDVDVGGADIPPQPLESTFSDLAEMMPDVPGKSGGLSARGSGHCPRTFLEDEDDEDGDGGEEAASVAAKAASTAAAKVHNGWDRTPVAEEKGTTTGAAWSSPHTRRSAAAVSCVCQPPDPLPEVRSAFFVEDDEDWEGDSDSPCRPCATQTASPPAERLGVRRAYSCAVIEEDDDDDDDDESAGADGSAPVARAKTRRSSVDVPPCSSDIRLVEATALGRPVTVIGQGGDRGSQVYRLDPDHVRRMKALKEKHGERDAGHGGGGESGKADIALLEALVQEAIAYKLYPVPISANELEFIETCFALTQLRAHILSPKNTDTNSSSCERRTREERALWRRQSFFENIGASFRFVPAARHRTDEEKMLYAAHHLVFPGAVVKREGEKRGLLMPLYDYSLKQFLVQHTEDRDRQLSSPDVAPQTSSLLSRVSYTPIRDPHVVAAIAFQVLEGIRLLNHHMPHSASVAPARGSRRSSSAHPACVFTGFTHNDLHMDNILLSRRGRVAVCDFELVENLPVPVNADGKRIVRDRSRLPPPCRRSPYGVFSASSDVWAFGLLIIALLTGVDPFFSNEALTNDFGDGPLLKPSSQAAPGESVVDWEGNIAPHVERLLHTADATGKLVQKCRPLLDVCAKSLVNAGGRKPADATALLREPVFASFLERPDTAEAVVGEWVRTFPGENGRSMGV